ncbi:MAG: hypothetical protein ABIH92_04645 [Nanoarchaeota archaeon]
MNLEEIEETYKKELEKIEKEFLQGIKDKKDTGEVEKDYLKKIKVVRERYYKEVTVFLEKQKKALKNIKKKKVKKEKVGRFKVEPGDFELSWWQKKKFSWGLRWFKVGFKTHNFRRDHTPNFVSYNWIIFRITMKKIFTKVRNAVAGFFEMLFTAIAGGYVSSKNLLKKVSKKVVELPGRIIGRLMKKKGGEEKKEGEGGKEEKEGEK